MSRRIVLHLYFFFFYLFFVCVASVVLVVPINVAWGEPVAQIGGQMTWEHQAQERHFQTRTPWTLRGGWMFERWDALLEYSSFSEGSGAGNLSVERRNQAWLGWARRRFPAVTGAGLPVVPVAAVALGLQYDRVKTHFMNETLTNRGRPLLLGAVATGAMLEIEDDIEVGLELRISASQNYRPNPLLSGVLLAGYRF